MYLDLDYLRSAAKRVLHLFAGIFQVRLGLIGLAFVLLLAVAGYLPQLFLRLAEKIVCFVLRLVGTTHRWSSSSSIGPHGGLSSGYPMGRIGKHRFDRARFAGMIVLAHGYSLAMMNTAPREMLVVVPAHNEERLLPGCLASIDRARRAVPVPVTVTVVLDACTDDSAAYTGLADNVVVIHSANVGAARAAGFARARTDSESWFVCTDADSIVTDSWLLQQWQHAARGARVLCGTVAVDDWAHLGAAARERHESGYSHRADHGHIHGANIGFRSEDYWAVGGFAALETGEDVDLVRRFVAHDIPVTWAGNNPVTTSSRLIGRARGGFADHLRELAS